MSFIRCRSCMHYNDVHTGSGCNSLGCHCKRFDPMGSSPEGTNIYHNDLRQGNLEKAFVLQREFMDMLVEHDRLPEFPVDLTTKPGQRLIKETAFNCIAELMEATVVLKNKMHRLSEETEVDFPHYREELGDAYAFFMEICILSGITPQELHDEFIRKNCIVRNRLLGGY